MASYMELRGTTFSTFTIGKRGPVLTKVGDNDLTIDAVDTTTAVDGGDITLNAGNSGTGTGGNVQHQGGSGTNGGSVFMLGGAGSTGNGGNIGLLSGFSVGGNTGQIVIQTLGTGTNQSGDISLTTGLASGTNGVAGDINITAGSGIGGAGGTGGDVNITAGDTTGPNGGNVNIKPGDGRNAINLLPAGTAVADTAELNFLELAANGTNSVGFKAPDAITTTVTWTLPDADGNSSQVLSTDGGGNLSWETVRFTPYEIYASTAQTLPAAATAVDFDTERFANPDYTSNGAGGVRVNPTGTNLYEITYSVSTDSTNGSRDTVLCQVYIDGVPYDASESYIYNRNVANGEGSAHKTVLASITSGSIVEVRADRLAGTGCTTIANASNLIIQQK